LSVICIKVVVKGKGRDQKLPNLHSCAMVTRDKNLTVLGTGLGSVCMSPLIALLIDEFNYFGTMLIIGGLLFNNVVGGALYRKPPETSRGLQDTPGLPVAPKPAAETGLEVPQNVIICCIPRIQ